MNELEQLIDQYDSREENKKSHPNKRTYARLDSGGFTVMFVEFILASRPSCGVEQRKLLDEMEKGNYQWYNGGIEFDDYSKFDFEKVIKGE